jgi:hypothetical protein
MPVSKAGIQSRILDFRGKNLPGRAAELVDMGDGMANSERQEDKVLTAPTGALLRIKVDKYIVVTRFQEVWEIQIPA